jgi:hypothetical protein
MGQLFEVKHILILCIITIMFSACRKELSFDQKNLTSELEKKLDDINARKIIIVSQSDEIINFILNARLEDGDRIDIDSYNHFFALLTPFDKQIELCNRSINDANKLIKKLMESGVEINIENQQIKTIGFLFKDNANVKIEEMIKQYILKNNMTESGKKKIYSFIKIALE